MEFLSKETTSFRSALALAETIEPCSGFEDYRPKLAAAWSAVAEFGLFKLLVPSGAFDPERMLQVLEGFGYGCRNPGLLLAIGAHCFGVGAPLRAFAGTVHGAYLDAVRSGSSVAALAATEPQAGSDVMSMTTSYDKHLDGYTLRGSKCNVTSVAEADFFLIFATKDTRLNYRGISAFLVDGNTRGLIRGQNERRLCVNGCSIGSLVLEDVVVPKSALLGRAGGGAAVFKHAMIWERSLIVGMLLGVIRRQLVSSLKHATTRYQFQRPIGANQHVSGRIVNMISKYVTSRLLIREALFELASNNLGLSRACLTKLHVSEAAVACSIEAVRIHGASGIMGVDSPACDVQDSLAATVYSGTSDLQKVVVASALGLTQ